MRVRKRELPGLCGQQLLFTQRSSADRLPAVCADIHSARVSPPIMIETPRTIIRPYTEADIARIAPILADPITMAFWPQPFSEAAAAAWVRRASASFPATGLG